MSQEDRPIWMVPVAAALAVSSAVCLADADPQPIGRFAKWSRVEIPVTGPDSRGAGEPNPVSIGLDVTLTSPSGRKLTVPGFYDGNGKGGLDGGVWKVRFSADETGSWSFESISGNALLNGQKGTFEVTGTPADARGFYAWGRLEYVGRRYLKFRDGPLAQGRPRRP